MSNAPFDLLDVREPFTDTDWFDTCRQTQTPYVVVRSGGAWADVFWDFITLPATCDARLRQDLVRLERDARAIFERYAVTDSYLRVKPTMICFDRLPFEHAESAASALYALISSYLSDTPERVLAQPHRTRQTRGQSVVAAPEQTDWSAPKRPWNEAIGLSHPTQ